MNVSVAGLGAIGYGMATSLVRAGHEVTGYDINNATLERLKKAGGHTVSKVRDLVSQAEVFICIVATSQQTWKLFFDQADSVLQHLPKGSVIILGITARPDFVSTFEKQIKTLGRDDISILDCPVSGGEARANSGTLSLMFSGSKDAITRSKPVLDAIGTKHYEIAGGLGSASRLKFVHQIFVGVNIVAAVETSALANIAGLPLQDVHTEVIKSDGLSWLYDQRVSHVLDSSAVPASSLSIIHKDMTSISAYCHEHKVVLATTSIAGQLLKFAAFRAWDLNDDTSLLNLYIDKQQTERATKAELAIEDIITLLFGIHTAASIEVLNLARHLQVDETMLANAVKESAGANKAFDIFLQSQNHSVRNDAYPPQYLEDLENKMTAVVKRLNEQGMPSPLSTTAAQVLLSATKTTMSNGVASAKPCALPGAS